MNRFVNKSFIKRLSALFLTLALAFSLGACSANNSIKSPTSESDTNMTNSSQPPSEPSETEETPATEPEKTVNTLVVYFSMPETTNPNNMTQEEDNSVVVIDGEVLGNTQYVAYVIQENTGADIFRIEPETPYPTDHETLVDLAKEEQNQNARPKLKASIENFEQYDTVFIGYPNWLAYHKLIQCTQIA